MKKPSILYLLAPISLLVFACQHNKTLTIKSDESVFTFNTANPVVTIDLPTQRPIPAIELRHHATGFQQRSMKWKITKTLQQRSTVFADSLGRTLVCTETFANAPAGLSWQVEWTTREALPFTEPLQTICQLSSMDSTVRFWTSWGDPSQIEPMDRAITLCKEWVDPLQPQPLRNMHLVYGGHKSLGGGFSLPAFTILYPQQNLGWSLIQSPLDPMLNMDLKTTAQGQMVFNRTDFRLQQSKPVRYRLYFITHEADWRGSLAWMVKQFPAFFNPPNPNAGRIAGCGLYSSYEGPFDEKKFHTMGGLVNWKASFDFPYMGMFIPPIQDPQQKWRRFKMEAKKPDTYTSIEQMAHYATSMREKGFYVLNYFNVTEFGAGIKYPPPEPFYQGPDLWQDANAFLYTRLNSAILYGAQQSSGEGWDNRTAVEQKQPKAGLRDQPQFTWGAAVAMDCGDSVYADFLTEQCRRHLALFPDAHGICIDRMDWLGEYNSRRDDGISWIGDKPCASLYFSWLNLMERIGPMWHGADKVIFCNPHVNRLELLKQIDGIYNEFGNVGFNLNMSAFLSLRKTLLAWTASVQDLKADPDRYLQHHLYMGAFPTAPFPGNDHTIEPDPWAEKYYLDYGPLFRLLIGKKWVLTPHAVTVQGQTAKANLFATESGYVVSVIHGSAAMVQIRLRGISTDDIISCKAVHPGGHSTAAFAENKDDQGLLIHVPLQRGCAMVVIATKKKA